MSEVKQLSNGLGALYGNGMIGKEEMEEIRGEYGPFSQFQEPAQWAGISGFWTVNETEAAGGEAIRYFEFSEPIGGGGGRRFVCPLPENERDGRIYLHCKVISFQLCLAKGEPPREEPEL